MDRLQLQNNLIQIQRCLNETLFKYARLMFNQFPPFKTFHTSAILPLNLAWNGSLQKTNFSHGPTTSFATIRSPPTCFCFMRQYWPSRTSIRLSIYKARHQPKRSMEHAYRNTRQASPTTNLPQRFRLVENLPKQKDDGLLPTERENC